jgi:hypothetical protein
MLHAILLAAAEGSEPSKTPFYVAGALLAAWAVLLGLGGLSRAEMPGNQGGERGIIGITVLLVAATISSAILTS